jgi:glycine dehydrogenase subunit 1
MLAATVYMEAMGKQGIKEVAEQSFQKAHYLAKKISELPGFSLAIEKPFFNEFLVKTPVPPSQVVKDAEEIGILAGIDTSRFEGYIEGLLIAVTEKRTKEEMDNFVNFLSRYAK